MTQIHNDFRNQLKEMGIIWVTPENEYVIKSDCLPNILELMANIGLKRKNENFGMMPKITGVELITGEVVEAVGAANYNNSDMELYGIFLYDYTKITYEKVKHILQNHFNIQSYN